MSGKLLFDIKRITEIIEQLISGRFYGSIIMKFEDGRILYIKKEETIKE